MDEHSGRCRGLSLSRRNGRIGPIISVLGVSGILVGLFQVEDVFHTIPSMRKAKVSLATDQSSFFDCSDASNSDGVRTQENHWGASEPVIVGSDCSTVLASTKSPDPLDWLTMCMENHDIYQQYMSSTKNHLRYLVPSSVNITNAPQNLHRKVSFLIIGDSLDRFMAYHICNITKATVKKVDPPEFAARRPFVCSTPTLEIGFFNIFGMNRTCENGNVARHQDDRVFKSTVERVQRLLPDVLSHMDEKPQFVQISSALWDLSNGCVGGNGVPKSYRKDYVHGMRSLYDHLTSEVGGIDNDASIYWRTSPPIRKSYSKKWERISWIPFNVGAHGRTRRNQKILNRLMKDTFSTFQLGDGIVDWWQVAQGVSENFLDEELPDGRHYSFCSCLVFFNELLDRIQISNKNMPLLLPGQ